MPRHREEMDLPEESACLSAVVAMKKNAKTNAKTASAIPKRSNRHAAWQAFFQGASSVHANFCLCLRAMFWQQNARKDEVVREGVTFVFFVNKIVFVDRKSSEEYMQPKMKSTDHHHTP